LTSYFNAKQSQKMVGNADLPTYSSMLNVLTYLNDRSPRLQ